jgi:hypothetical protein
MNSNAVRDLPVAAPAPVAESAVHTAELNCSEQQQQHSISSTTNQNKVKKDAIKKSVSIRKLFSVADKTDKVFSIHTFQSMFYVKHS